MYTQGDIDALVGEHRAQLAELSARATNHAVMAARLAASNMQLQETLSELISAAGRGVVATTGDENGKVVVPAEATPASPPRRRGKAA